MSIAVLERDLDVQREFCTGCRRARVTRHGVWGDWRKLEEGESMGRMETVLCSTCALAEKEGRTKVFRGLLEPTNGNGRKNGKPAKTKK